MNKYYYLNEEGNHHFLETKPEGNNYLKFGKKKIKYRFLEQFNPEGMEELGYYAYKRILDKTINEL